MTTLTEEQELGIASTMRGLAILFEGEALNRNRVQYQAMIGWDPAVARDRCRLIDASGCDGVVAVFDPEDVEQGPAAVGVCVADGTMLRLEIGDLWLGRPDGRAVLVTAGGRSHLRVGDGRFVERKGRPVPDLTRGKARAKTRLTEIAAERDSLFAIVIEV